MNVPIVPAYDITRGQFWATSTADGRYHICHSPMMFNDFKSFTETFHIGTRLIYLQPAESCGGTLVFSTHARTHTRAVSR